MPKGNYKHKLKHGFAHTKFYRTWASIKTRCSNKNSKYYRHYGGRGIIFDKQWEKFENFLNDMYKSYLKHIEQFGEKNTTIERKNNNGNYCKKNCRWATPKEQLQNTRRNVWLECDGIKMIKTGWMRELSISHKFIDDRLKKNIPFSEIVKQAREHVLKKAIRHWGEDLRQDDFENGYGVQI